VAAKVKPFRRVFNCFDARLMVGDGHVELPEFGQRALNLLPEDGTGVQP
jgi:hypothetical protein